MKVKVCGLRDNIEEVAQLAPDFMGFIFYPKSKRYVGKDFVMPKIASSIKKIGVFVNENAETVLSICNKYKLNGVQLHGDETPEYCANVKALLSSSFMLVKAFGIDDNFDFSLLKNYEEVCDAFLFDTKTADYGGSGKSFDWNVLSNYNGAVPIFLSGGIDVSKVGEVKHLRLGYDIYCVDVNSKFEKEPGLKNIELLKEIL